EEIDGELARPYRQMLRENRQIDDAEQIIEGEIAKARVIGGGKKRHAGAFRPGANPGLLRQHTGNFSAGAFKRLRALNEKGSLTHKKSVPCRFPSFSVVFLWKWSPLA